MAEFKQNQDQNQNLNPPPPPEPTPAPAPQPEPEHETHLIDEIPRKNKFATLVKNLVVLVILVTVILGSFWVSFNLGKKLLMPVKKTGAGKIDVSIPEPPASIAHLQKLDKLIAPTNRVRNRVVVWSHPAFAYRHIFARNDREILCASLAQEEK